MAEFIVTNANDAGEGSLREAILAANATIGVDSITFEIGLSGATIALTTGELLVVDDLTIQGDLDGDGVGDIAIDAGGNSRVLNIDDGDDATIAVELSGLTIAGGTATDFGGGIFNAESLALVDSTVSNNSATFNGGGIFNPASSTLTLSNSTVSDNFAFNGGGIANFASSTLTLSDSTVSGNSAATNGGGIANYASSTLTLSNSTVSGNSVGGSGGGIFNTFSSATLTNSTVSGNAASDGGGIFNTSPSTLTLDSSTVSGNSATNNGGGIISASDPQTEDPGTLSLLDTIVAGNGAAFDPDINTDANTVLTASNTLIQVGNGAIANGANGNLVGVDPLLDPAGLQDNGGPTQTIALLPGSPAIDTGSNPDNLTFDQRGEAFDRIVGAAADIGAFEVQNQPPVITSSATPSVAENTSFAVDIEAIDDLDSEGNGLTFSLTGGADSDSFTLDADTGELSFIEAPDFEVPSSADGDNFSEITVIVVDSDGLLFAQDLTIEVTDVDEPIAELPGEPTDGPGGVTDVDEPSAEPPAEDLEPAEPADGSDAADPESDGLQGGVNIEAIAETILTGSGDDSVDLPFLQEDAANNIVQTGSGNDTIIASTGDIIAGGSDDDEFFTTAAISGGNRLAGGIGNDIFHIAGSGDRFLGDAGEDTFNIEGGSNNILAGGAGADRFNLLTGDAATPPGTANIITDFVMGEDSLGLLGQGEDFDFTARVLLEADGNISIDGILVATLIGVDASVLGAEDFQLA